MKPFGPYVAARELPGGTGVVRTLRATERLTGMPVLLHVLPYAVNLPDLPAHPNLLPIVDGGMQGEEAYVVSELPLQASLATDPLLAARGALRALEALHARGLVHGGVSATQLWSVDGQVSLAGAGLPWHSEPDGQDDVLPAAPGVQDDLRDLMQALRHIGVFPKALKPVQDQPEAWTAAQALALLDAPPVAEQPEQHVDLTAAAQGEGQAERPERAAPEHHEVALTASSSSIQEAEPAQPAAAVPAESPVQSKGRARSEEVLGRSESAPHPETSATSTAPDPASSLVAPAQSEKSAKSARSSKRKQKWAGLVHAPSPGVHEEPDRTLEPRTPSPTPSVQPVPRSGEIAEDAPPATEPTALPVNDRLTKTADEGLSSAEKAATGSTSSSAHHSPVPSVDDARDTGPETPAPAATQAAAASDMPLGRPVPAYSSAPAGTVETPQERRRRQNEERREQAMLDAKAAAERKVQRLRAEAAARQAQGEDTPVRIGLDDELPAWDAPEPQEAQGGSGVDGPRRLQLRNVERLPATLRRPVDEREPPAPPAMTLAEKKAEEQQATSSTEAGHLPARRYQGEPIRIGWDEDDSWRVVKPAPALPERAPQRIPGWVWLGLATLLLLGGVIWAVRGSGATPPSPARAAPQATTQANCCAVQFRVSGSSGKTARISVLAAPAAASLKVGQALGSAPGTIKFPVRGQYRLQISVQGYTPNSLTVRVPEDSPVEIGLGE